MTITKKNYLLNSIDQARRAPVTKKKMTFPSNNFKIKKDINIWSFFPKKYYSLKALYVKFICLSVKKRFECERKKKYLNFCKSIFYVLL